MIVPEMAISNLVLTRQKYSEEANGAYAHNPWSRPFKGLVSLNFMWIKLQSFSNPIITNVNEHR